MEPRAGTAVDRVGWSGPTPPLHARQQFEFSGPPPRAALAARTSVAAVRRRPSRRLGRVAEGVLVTRFTPAGEESPVVAVARSTSVQPLEPVTSGARPLPLSPRRTAGSGPPAVRVLGPITLTDVVRYQGASGDLNPVHHDSAAVRETGWPAVLVPGPYPAAVLCDLAAEQHGADRLRRADLRFAASCWVGDTLLCSIAPPTVTDGLLRVEPGCGRESDGRRVTSAVVDFVTDLPR